ncbi:MAG: hypothetical protein WKG01_30540 [Kofleriaceae bacterium]
MRERLALRRNRSLYSRIHHRLEISTLTPDDTTECMRMRMARAACTREVFAGDAIVLLHEATVGAMRDLDCLAAPFARPPARSASSSSAMSSVASSRPTPASATATDSPSASLHAPRHIAKAIARGALGAVFATLIDHAASFAIIRCAS